MPTRFFFTYFILKIALFLLLLLLLTNNKCEFVLPKLFIIERVNLRNKNIESN